MFKDERKKTNKTISSEGRPDTWVWKGPGSKGNIKKFGLVVNKRMELKDDKVPPEDVDWWNSVWEFPDQKFEFFGKVSYKEHPAQYNPMLIEQLIYRYTNIGDKILDPMAGSGTTLVVSRFMKRNSVGVDCSDKYIKIMEERSRFPSLVDEKYMPEVIKGNAMNLKFTHHDKFADDSFDFICFSPPYFDIKEYPTSHEEHLIQIGFAKSEKQFLDMMKKVLSECHRVLKPGKFCACVVSNIRKGKIIPIAWKLGLLGEEVGFYLWDDIIHHTSHSRSKAVLRGGRWSSSIRLRHSVRTHEYVIVWKKLTYDERRKIKGMVK